VVVAPRCRPPVASKSQVGRVIDEAPRPGSRGETVPFVHLKGAFGVFIELVQV
jgi:methylmalonyl-CoA/ethylmalonyl-CoA epimerase